MAVDPRSASVQFLPGVGPARAAEFAKLGITTVGELLWHLPTRYELQPKSQAIGSLRLGETATVVAKLRSVRTGGVGISAELVDGTGRCRIKWFNMPYLSDKLRVGQVIRITGTVQFDEQSSLGRFVNPTFRVLAEDEDPFGDDRDEFVPVYPATSNLSSAIIARSVQAALTTCTGAIDEILPDALREQRGLPPRAVAFERVHKPVTEADGAVARRRLAYDELLLTQLAVQQGRRARRATGAPAIQVTPVVDERIRARLPFTLTAAQERAVADIVRDLGRPTPMARLLQGDVGAGKTAVAVYAALATIANRCQVAMLAPTEILARQTYARFAAYLEGSRVRMAFLAGGLSRQRRDELRGRLAAAELDLIVGTHALLEEDVRFPRLGLAIIDEQHRFGVAQRQALRLKGHAPHYLLMTATPIPRTLAMTLYGDLDVSIIDELPPGRQPVTTRLIAASAAQEAWDFVRTRLEAGERAFVVYPLVEESDALELQAATAEAERLARVVFPQFAVGLLHGRMSADEKAAALADFRCGKTQILAATTVIEVGVDVPEATVMVVAHAERYGLAQLHQLRGRIGRGALASYCLLLAEVGAGHARERLEVLCRTQDGFVIAEADLLQRGPGELIGKRQHGLPEFHAANLTCDLDLLTQARDDAASLLTDDPELSAPVHTALAAALTAYISSPSHVGTT
jgi:ATP-dependent DNA helicase RecG